MNIKLAAIFNSNLMYFDRQSLFVSALDLFEVNDVSEEIVDRMFLFRNKTQVCVCVCVRGHGDILCYCLCICYLYP